MNEKDRYQSGRENGEADERLLSKVEQRRLETRVPVDFVPSFLSDSHHVDQISETLLSTQTPQSISHIPSFSLTTVTVAVVVIVFIVRITAVTIE